MQPPLSPGLSPRATRIYLATILLSFLAASSAPTPLYRLYQEAWSFSPAMLTLIFAVYALSLLGALLTVGSLSDHIGRRPVIFAALVLEMASLALFITAQDVGLLIAARVVQGFATGMATSVLGAALLDSDKQQGPLINSVAPLLGMACGALGTGMLVEFAPSPLRMAYWVLLVMFAAQTLMLACLRESVSRQAGAWASLVPKVRVPQQARVTLWRVLPVDLACWALGGFFLSLAPSLVRAATGLTSNLLGGALVATLTLSGAAAIFSLRAQPAHSILRLGTFSLVLGLAIFLSAVHSGNLGLFFLGTLVAGCGFGAGFMGAVRSVMPLAEAHERAGLMAAFYVLSYLAFCVPALVAGLLVREVGLVTATDGYAVVLLMLCSFALLGMWARRRAGQVVE